jgi:uridylate kinase
VIAAAGAWEAYRATDHAAVARDSRFSREGYQYY